MTDYVLGVDGGNTKTIALVAGLDGAIVGVGRAGCSDMYSVGDVDCAVEAIDQAVGAALDMAGVGRCDLAAAAFSLAGADWPEDHVLLQSRLRTSIPCTMSVANDALGALWAGSPSGTGVAVVCGTGLAVGGRTSSGQVWHGSFWLEAHGGGVLGRAALRAVYRAELGIDPPTSLTDRVLTYFNQSSVEGVLHLLTAFRPLPAPPVAGLAPLLMDEADVGDPVAREIVRKHGAGIGDYVVAAARTLGIQHEPFPLVLAGGVLRHHSHLLADSLMERVRGAAPGVVPVRGGYEPAIGALFMALTGAGMSLDAAVRAQVERTMPAASVFATVEQLLQGGPLLPVGEGGG